MLQSAGEVTTNVYLDAIKWASCGLTDALFEMWYRVGQEGVTLSVQTPSKRFTASVCYAPLVLPNIENIPLD